MDHLATANFALCLMKKQRSSLQLEPTRCWTLFVSKTEEEPQRAGPTPGTTVCYFTILSIMTLIYVRECWWSDFNIIKFLQAKQSTT